MEDWAARHERHMSCQRHRPMRSGMSKSQKAVGHLRVRVSGAHQKFDNVQVGRQVNALLLALNLMRSR